MPYAVYSYNTQQRLAGTPSNTLVAESLATHEGVVAAYCEHNTWHHLDVSLTRHYRQTLGVDVYAVYVTEES